MNTAEKGLSEDLISYKDNLSSLDEEIVEISEIPETEYMAFITNSNALYLLKERKFLQRVELQIGFDFLKEKHENKTKNQMISLKSNEKTN